MFRPVALRSLQRTLPGRTQPLSKSAWRAASIKVSPSTQVPAINGSKRLSLAIRKPAITTLVRYQSSVDKTPEAGFVDGKLASRPDLVSADSSVRHVRSEWGERKQEEDDVDMMAGIKSDWNTVLDTFSLKDVPKEALYVGMAGVLPYLATSLSTVYLAWDIQHAAHTGQGFLLSGATAEQLLHILEPIQLGYGATIISFLGAIHWGFEWAGFGGHQGYKRYAIGICATAVAWPTLLFSAEIGLITQLLAFIMLYYADAVVTVRGWCPPWYSVYRFVLTFVVGASIVFSLTGRGQVADLVTKPLGPAERMAALREGQMEQLEKEQAEKRARIVQEDELAEEADEVDQEEEEADEEE